MDDERLCELHGLEPTPENRRLVRRILDEHELFAGLAAGARALFSEESANDVVSRWPEDRRADARRWMEQARAEPTDEWADLIALQRGLPPPTRAPAPWGSRERDDYARSLVQLVEFREGLARTLRRGSDSIARLTALEAIESSHGPARALRSPSLAVYKAVDAALAKMERVVPLERLRALLDRFDSTDAQQDARVLAAHDALARALRGVRDRIKGKEPDPCTLRRGNPAELAALAACMTAWPNSMAPARLQRSVDKNARKIGRSRSPEMLTVAATVLAGAGFTTAQKLNRLRTRYGRADKGKQAAAAVGSAIGRGRRVESRSPRSDD